MAWVSEATDQTERSDEKLAPFLKKTWDIVEDPTIDNVVKWSPHGKSFIVLDVELFAKEILPKFFKHSNWSSFVRQLNTYGFRKIDPDRWEFANEHFTKGGREFLTAIQRKKPSATPAMVIGRGMEPQLQPMGGSDMQQSSALPTQAMTPGISHALPAAYPLDLRTPGLPLFQPQPGSATPSVCTPLMCLTNVQAAGAAGSKAYGGAHVSAPSSMPLEHQHSSQAAAVPAAAAAAVPSRSPYGVDRLNALVGEYLRPGQQILLNIGIQQDSGGKSTSTTSGPSASTTDGDLDMDEERKSSKRTRGDMHALSSRLDVSGPSQMQGVSSEHGSKTCVDQRGQPLPPGITRPIAQPLGITAQNLIAEMAGQLGKLSQLASEVEGLREDNVQLRHGMDAMYAKQATTLPSPEVAPIHAMMAEQRDKMWMYKLKNDEVELQMAAQQQAQVVQQERSSAIEARLAQQYKLSFDTAEVTRFLEAKNHELALKLAIQENVNQSQQHANAALEARVAELEEQLTDHNGGTVSLAGRRNDMLKGLEDRLMTAVTMRLAGAEAARAKARQAGSQGDGGPSDEQAAPSLAADMASGSRLVMHSKQSNSNQTSQSQDTGSSHAAEDDASYRTMPVLGALEQLTCDEAVEEESSRLTTADNGPDG